MKPLLNKYYCDSCDQPGHPERDLGPFYGYALYSASNPNQAALYKRETIALKHQFPLKAENPDILVSHVVSLYEVTWDRNEQGFWKTDNPIFRVFSKRPKSVTPGVLWVDPR